MAGDAAVGEIGGKHVEPEIAFLLFLAMALNAMLLEERLHDRGEFGRVSHLTSEGRRAQTQQDHGGENLRIGTAGGDRASWRGRGRTGDR